MAEHRVSMLSASLRRYEDPERSADRRIRQLVAQLATLDPAPAPRAHFRAELRAQLVAVAPRLIAEGPAVAAPGPVKERATPAHAGAQPSGTRLQAVFGRLGQVSIARPLGVITAVIAVFAVLLGGAVWVSKKALPGDSLYALKRANENVQLSFATGDTAKGREYLTFAKNRAEEVSTLLAHSSAMAGGTAANAAGGVNSHTAHLIMTTLNEADNELRSASQLLGGQAVRNGSGSPLSIMTGWAPGQLARLHSIADRLGAGALYDRAATSTELTAGALSRAKALQAVVGCDCLSKVATDPLGPVPCTVCDVAPTPGQSSGPPTGNPPTHASTAPTKKPTAKPSTGAVPTGPATVPGGQSTETGPGSGATSGTAPSLPIPLPSLPIPLPTATATQPTSGGSSTDRTCTITLLGICL